MGGAHDPRDNPSRRDFRRARSGQWRQISLTPGPPALRTARHPKRSSGGWARWLRIGLGFGIIALLLTQIDLAAALRAVVEARVEPLLLGFAIVLGSRLLAGVRWYVLLRGRHAAVTLAGLLRLMFVADFVGYFMPGSLAVEVLRV